MKVEYFFVAIALGLATPAAAEMSVGTFVGKADALKAKGILAMASSDIGLLKAEVQSAGTAYRARLAADQAAKRPVHSCPPPKGSVTMQSDELIAHFRTLPAATGVNDGFAALMKKKFPCARK